MKQLASLLTPAIFLAPLPVIAEVAPLSFAKGSNCAAVSYEAFQEEPTWYSLNVRKGQTIRVSTTYGGFTTESLNVFNPKGIESSIASQIEGDAKVYSFKANHSGKYILAWYDLEQLPTSTAFTVCVR